MMLDFPGGRLLHGADGCSAGPVSVVNVRNHRVNQETSSLLARWYDFLVEIGLSQGLSGAGLPGFRAASPSI
ncbi:hypothetical protein AB0323_10205 [Arthrobacter sp. NPDC080031]|uniref:hypothetical protein n=1 Tax=Arthrobacter sp. NPDC080031 TaxID=3155918 RepID=UPI003450394E